MDLEFILCSNAQQDKFGQSRNYTCFFLNTILPTHGEISVPRVCVFVNTPRTVLSYSGQWISNSNDSSSPQSSFGK